MKQSDTHVWDTSIHMLIYKSTLLEIYSSFLLCGKLMSNWLLIIINFYLSLMMMNQDCRNTPSPYQLSCACSDGSGNNNTRDFWGNFLVVHCQCIYKVLRDVKIYIPWKFIRIQCILPAHLLYVHNNLYIYFNLPNCRLSITGMQVEWILQARILSQ